MLLSLDPNDPQMAVNMVKNYVLRYDLDNKRPKTYVPVRIGEKLPDEDNGDDDGSGEDDGSGDEDGNGDGSDDEDGNGGDDD